MESTAQQSFDQYLKVNEAAEFLGVSTSTLRNWDKSGKLRSLRHPLNGYRIYRHEDLQAILRADSLQKPEDEMIAPRIDWSDMNIPEHFVQFYESHSALIDSAGGFIGASLKKGHGGVVIATEEHRQAISSYFTEQGIDVDKAVASGQLVMLDAAETLTKFMVGGSPDPKLFKETVGEVVAKLAGRFTHLRAFGEMVALLWAEGNREAAIQLEELWNALSKVHRFALFCAYPLKEFSDSSDSDSYSHVCDTHERVIPIEKYTLLKNKDDRLSIISLLQQKTAMLEAEITHRREIEKALLRREQEFKDFFENAAECIHTVGPDGTILWANKEEFKLLGYAPEEYIGHHIAEFYADDEVIADILDRLQKGEVLRNHQARIIARDDSIKHVIINSNAYIEDGKLLYTRCFTRDITDRKKIEDAPALLAAVVESSEDAIISKNLHGRILSWNRAAERLFGYTADEAIGQSITMLIPEDRLSEETEIISRLKRGERIEHYETVRKTKDNRLIDLSLSISPVRDSGGNIVGASKVARDITEHKRVLKALLEADRRKDEFLATLAHELRNPLAPIKNALHVLESPRANAVMKEEALNLMRRQVFQMTRLIDDLMDVSRVSQGKIELQKEQVLLHDIIQAAVETARPLIGEKKHNLTITQPPDPIWLDVDIVRLAQVFSNLLNNAAKYTNPGGTIAVNVRVEGQEVIVSVKDNGIGISREKLPFIFDLFMQIDNSLERTQGGLGIGLTLVKELVEMHCGHVSAHSEGEGKGSEFSVHLPLATRKASEVQSIAPVEPAHAFRVLVVDDNLASAKTLGWSLELLGHQVALGHNLQTAMDQAHKLKPEVILLDIGLPGANGYEVCKVMRQDPSTKNAYIVAQTGWGQEEHRRRSQEAGFDHHMVKPIDIHMLEELMTSLSEKNKA